MARVKFPDKDNLVSGWLQAGVPNTKKNKDEFHLDIDEHVLCLMLGNGLEHGFVVCSLWDNKNKPPFGDSDNRRTEFEDGTVVQYSRSVNVLLIDCSKSGGAVSIIAPGGVVIQGDVDVQGSINASGSIIDVAGNTNHHGH